MQQQHQIFTTAKKYNQQHLVEHYHALTTEHQRTQFIRQLNSIDFQQTQQLYDLVYLESKSKKEVEINFSPIENVTTHEDLKVHQQEFDEIGYKSIANGQMAVCIMSGGQGTRLGFDHPKGMFNLGLQCGLTIFGFYAKRLLRLNELVKERSGIKQNKFLIKWYLMTSDMNHHEIETYFKSNQYFGFPSESIVFFPQGGIPALAYNGKIIIEAEGKISLAPGGNGAIYTEMRNHHVLRHMKENGIKYIYIGPVDNILLKLGDPTSLGYMIKHQYDIVLQYIKKCSAEEKVGLLLNMNGKTSVCEYSEATKQVKELKNQKGEFVYGSGNRATMYITREFIQKITNDKETMQNINKKYHLAEKAIKYYDQGSKTSIKPAQNNGVKFQLFNFDVFGETNKIGLFETIREEEFAPLKNATGNDSPQTARKFIKDLHKKWLIENGVEFEGEGQAEIYPGLSYNGQGLKDIVLERYGVLKVKLPFYLK